MTISRERVMVALQRAMDRDPSQRIGQLLLNATREHNVNGDTNPYALCGGQRDQDTR